MKDLACSQVNFEQLLELFTHKIEIKAPLLELTVNGLSRDLMIVDENLIKRFGRAAQTVRKLSIGNIRQTRPETRQILALLILTIL